MYCAQLLSPEVFDSSWRMLRAGRAAGQANSDWTRDARTEQAKNLPEHERISDSKYEEGEQKKLKLIGRV